MNYVNRFAALVSGAALPTAAVYAAEFTEIQTGNAGLDQAIRISQIALFSLAWSWLTFRLIARPPAAILWCIAGLIIGMLAIEVMGAVELYHECQSVRRTCSFPTSLLESLGYWSWLSSLPWLLAFVSGIAAAAAIVLKSKRITVRPVPA